jgi:murein DD-endopeptidase MepM/ murein hydrolase activator NlpD
MPIAVAPTPAVLPIRQTSTTERPAGISMPVPPRVAPMPAFQRPSYADVPMVPLAVPAPPTPPAGLAAPDYLAFQPAQSAQSAQSARSAKRPAFPARLLGRGKAAGAARLLVLALVVGAEGVAVTTMSGHARSVPIDASVSSAFELTNASAALATQRQQAAETALLETHQRDSSSAKVTAAVAQAKAAAARVRAANERKAAVLRDAQNNPQAAAKVMLIDRGWGSAQFSCLVSLWNKESGWNYRAENPSGAYGIPQSLPGNKMASAGSDWRTNPVTQIRWGLDYIADRYGTPCGAWAHSEQYNSY